MIEAGFVPGPLGCTTSSLFGTGNTVRMTTCTWIFEHMVRHATVVDLMVDVISANQLIVTGAKWRRLETRHTHASGIYPPTPHKTGTETFKVKDIYGSVPPRTRVQYRITRISESYSFTCRPRWQPALSDTFERYHCICFGNSFNHTGYHYAITRSRVLLEFKRTRKELSLANYATG